VLGGHAAFVCSQDFDSLLFGSPVLVRNLTVTGRRKLPRKQIYMNIEPERIELAVTLAALGLNRRQLVEMLVALMIAAIFFSVLTGVILATFETLRTGDERTVAQENARVGLNYIANDIRHATEIAPLSFENLTSTSAVAPYLRRTAASAPLR
jgi:Mg2+/citrate symporter